MSSHTSQLSFPTDKSRSSSQSTEDDIPLVREVTNKYSQNPTQPCDNLKLSKYFHTAQLNAQRYSPSFTGILVQLREQIYKHIFSNSLIHVSRRHRFTNPSIKSCSFNHILLWKPSTFHPGCNAYIHYECSRSLSILSASRRTRQDAMPFYITLPVFRVHGPALMCADWLQTFSLSDRRMLKEVRFSDPYEHLSILAGSLRKNAARESLGGILGEMTRRGVVLEDGILRVRHNEEGKVEWKKASVVKRELGGLK